MLADGGDVAAGIEDDGGPLARPGSSGFEGEDRDVRPAVDAGEHAVMVGGGDEGRVSEEDESPTASITRERPAGAARTACAVRELLGLDVLWRLPPPRAPSWPPGPTKTRAVAPTPAPLTAPRTWRTIGRTARPGAATSRWGGSASAWPLPAARTTATDREVPPFASPPTNAPTARAAPFAARPAKPERAAAFDPAPLRPLPGGTRITTRRGKRLRMRFKAFATIHRRSGRGRRRRGPRRRAHAFERTVQASWATRSCSNLEGADTRTRRRRALLAGRGGTPSCRASPPETRADGRALAHSAASSSPTAFVKTPTTP